MGTYKEQNCQRDREGKGIAQEIGARHAMKHCDDVDNGFDNTCEVIRQETVLFSTPETDYIIYD